MLDTTSILMLTYIDELLLVIDQLEGTQRKMKTCHDFLNEHAARSEPYVSTQYFEDQINALLMCDDKPVDYRA